MRARLEGVKALVQDLVEAAYTHAGISERLGEVAAAALQRDQLTPARHALAGANDATAVLVRLFALGESVPWRDLDAALPRAGAAALQRLGLVSSGDGPSGHGANGGGALGGDGASDRPSDGACVRALLDLAAVSVDGHDWWVVSDLDSTVTGEPLREEHVLGVGGASITVAEWTPRARVASALDVGAGSGIQSLLLSTHAQRVVATDVSERALTLAALNAELNGVGVDLRQGDLFDPAPERFELIVSNPPFVISPRGGRQFTYRDGGRAGHALVREVVRGAADHLEPGGAAVLLANWELRAGQDWRDVVTEWLEPTGLDAFVVQRDVVDVASYAETWTADGGHRQGSSVHQSMYEAWLDDFAIREVTAVGFGVMVLQRPLGHRPPWRRLLEHVGPVAHPMGPAVEAILQACTWLAQASDQDLVTRTWALAPDVTEARHGRPGAPDPAVIELHQGWGLRRTHRLTTAQAAFVSVCDGTVPAAAACQAIAALTDTDEPAVRAEVVALIRELVADGFLHEADAS